MSALCHDIIHASFARRSITRIKDTGLSKTDVNQERKALSERITLTKDVPKESHEDTTNNKHSSSSAETDSEESETSEESSEEASEGQEIMLRATTKIISKKPGSESDSESEKNPKNSRATQNGSNVANSPRTRNPTFLRMNNKNVVSTSATTNSYTSRPINSVARTYPAAGRQMSAVERREDTGKRSLLLLLCTYIETIMIRKYNQTLFSSSIEL